MAFLFSVYSCHCPTICFWVEYQTHSGCRRKSKFIRAFRDAFRRYGSNNSSLNGKSMDRVLAAEDVSVRLMEYIIRDLACFMSWLFVSVGLLSRSVYFFPVEGCKPMTFSCMLQLVINGKPLRIMGSAMSGVNLENCAHPCLRNPCDHGGECVPEMDSFKCHCPLGYRDSYCQSRMDKQDVITAPKLIGDSYLKFTHPRIIKRLVRLQLNINYSSFCKGWS